MRHARSSMIWNHRVSSSTARSQCSSLPTAPGWSKSAPSWTTLGPNTNWSPRTQSWCNVAKASSSALRKTINTNTSIIRFGTRRMGLLRRFSWRPYLTTMCQDAWRSWGKHWISNLTSNLFAGSSWRFTIYMWQGTCTTWWWIQMPNSRLSGPKRWRSIVQSAWPSTCKSSVMKWKTTCKTGLKVPCDYYR